MTAQVSRPSMISSLKRGASQPLSSTVPAQRRRSRPAHPFIHPAIPPWNRLAPSVPNTPQAIPPMIRAAHPLTPQAYSSIPLIFPTAWTQSAPSAPNITQTIPPLMQTPPFLPPHDKRFSSLHPSSCTPPLPNQQLIARSLAQQRLKAPIIPSAPNIAPVYIKYKGIDLSFSFSSYILCNFLLCTCMIVSESLFDLLHNVSRLTCINLTSAFDQS